MANNPARYTDNNGGWVHIAVGALLGAGSTVYAIVQESKGWDNFCARIKSDDPEVLAQIAYRVTLGGLQGGILAAFPVAKTVSGLSIAVLETAAIGTAFSVADLTIRDLPRTKDQFVAIAKTAVLNGIKTGLLFGIAGKLAIPMLRAGTRYQYNAASVKYPFLAKHAHPEYSAWSLAPTTANSACDIFRATWDNHWENAITGYWMQAVISGTSKDKLGYDYVTEVTVIRRK